MFLLEFAAFVKKAKATLKIANIKKIVKSFRKNSALATIFREITRILTLGNNLQST